MNLPFLQAVEDAFDKIEALRGGNSSDALFWHFMVRAFLFFVLLSCAYVLLRNVVGRRRERRRKASQPRPRAAAPAGTEMVGPWEPRDAPSEPPPLDRIPLGTKVTLFWNTPEARHHGLAEIVGAADGQVTIRVDEGAPKAGEARLVCPDSGRHALIFDVDVIGVDRADRRIVSAPGGLAEARLHRKHRVEVGVRAAAVIDEKRDGDETPRPLIARVHDMSLEGFGILCEDQLKRDDKITLRLPFADYATTITALGEVVWVRNEVAGIYRAGVMLTQIDTETRHLIADFIYGATPLPAESPEQKDAEPVTV